MTVEPTLTEDQQTALREILAALKPGERHLLTGWAGTGKTTLMQAVTRALVARGASVVLCAPTHKAVAVLTRKLREAGLADVPTATLHRLLSLRPVKGAIGEAAQFARARNADPVTADVVVIDECSMIEADVMRYVRRHLAGQAVLFVGDPAQLPPIGERESESFATRSRSHLGQVVRQAEGNPILAAARVVRDSQASGTADWSWIAPAHAKPYGIYLPGERSTEWMRRAFTSDEFKADPDRFRYLCWTNDRAIGTNQRVRRWIYGNTETPFVPGERVLFRDPLVIEDKIVFSSNEEADVVEIERGEFRFVVPPCDGAQRWVVSMPSWSMLLARPDGRETEAVHMPSDRKIHQRVIDRLTDEAHDAPKRWDHLRAYRHALADLRHIYAMTVHTSQGSTLSNVFIDVADIKGRARDDLLECQKLFYVALTRATHAAILVNT